MGVVCSRSRNDRVIKNDSVEIEMEMVYKYNSRSQAQLGRVDAYSATNNYAEGDAFILSCHEGHESKASR